MSASDCQNGKLYSQVASIVGAVFCSLIVLYNAYQYKRNKHVLWPIVHVSLATEIRDCANAFGQVDDMVYCEMQAFFKNFGGVATFLFVLYISVDMIRILLSKQKNDIQNNHRNDQKNHHKITRNFLNIIKNIYLWIWCIAVSISLVPFGFNAYGPMTGNDHWCWIRQRYSKSLWIACFYGWLVLCLLCLFIAIIIACFKQNSVNHKLMGWFYYVPLHFMFWLLIVWSFAVMRRAFIMFEKTQITSHCDSFIQAVSTSSYGIIAGLSYLAMKIYYNQCIKNKLNKCEQPDEFDEDSQTNTGIITTKVSRFPGITITPSTATKTSPYSVIKEEKNDEEQTGDEYEYENQFGHVGSIQMHRCVHCGRQNHMIMPNDKNINEYQNNNNKGSVSCQSEGIVKQLAQRPIVHNVPTPYI